MGDWSAEMTHAFGRSAERSHGEYLWSLRFMPDEEDRKSTEDAREMIHTDEMMTKEDLQAFLY